MSSFAPPQTHPSMTETVSVRFNVEEGKRLKALGDDLYQQSRYTEAIKKYTEAAKADPTNPLVYANRAAAHIHEKEYMDAALDCEKAVNLDPAYAKAWARLGTALRDAQSSWDECSSAWNRALECLPKSNLTLTEADLKREVEGFLKQSQAESAKNADCAKLAPARRSIGLTSESSPWTIAAALTERKEQEALASLGDTSTAIVPSCVFALNYANKCFQNANDALQSLAQSHRPGHSMAVSSHGTILENLANAILVDERVFHADSPHEFYGTVANLYCIESIACRSLAEGGGLDNIKREASRRLRVEGWESLRVSLSLTIRWWLFQAHWRSYLYGPTIFSYHLYTRVLEFIQWGKSQWQNTLPSEGGTIFEFQQEIVRGVMRLRLQTMQLLLENKPYPEVEKAFSVRHFIGAADELLRDTNAHDMPHSSQGLPIGHTTAFWTSCLAHGYSALGFAHFWSAQSGRSPERRNDALLMAKDHYTSAIAQCPTDDPNHALFVRKQLECHCYLSRPLSEILPICTYLRDTVPTALAIWKEPHEAGSALISNRDQVQQFQEWCEKEVAAGRLGMGVADRVLVPQNTVYTDISAVENLYEPGRPRGGPVERIEDMPGPSVKN